MNAGRTHVEFPLFPFPEFNPDSKCLFANLAKKRGEKEEKLFVREIPVRTIKLFLSVQSFPHSISVGGLLKKTSEGEGEENFDKTDSMSDVRSPLQK